MGRANAFACYRELGAELRKRREAAGVTAARVAHQTGWDHARVSRIESGRIGISDVDVIFYLGACGIYAKDAKELLRLCRTAQHNRGYWLSPRGEWLESSLASLIYHESTTDRLISFEPFVVPGLLQTPAYARKIIAPTAARMSGSVDEAVEVRIHRQEILRRRNPAEFVFFVHEQAFRTRIRDAAIMHEQLLHVVLMSALGHITLRIIPAAVEQSEFGGPFQLFEHRKHYPLAYLDAVLTGMFIEDRDVVGDYYRLLLPELRAVALDAGQSREFAAKLADEFDRGSAPDVRVEEEHLQRRW